MITIYTRSDLVDHSKINNISRVKYTDFRLSRDPFLKSDLVLFVDRYEFKVMKNRLPYPAVDTLFPVEHLDNVVRDMLTKSVIIP